MANILCLLPPKRIFADICGMIADTFKSTRYENNIEVGRYLVRINPHPFGQLVVETGIQVVQVTVSRFQLQSELRISIHERTKAITEYPHGLPVQRLEQKNF